MHKHLQLPRLLLICVLAIRSSLQSSEETAATNQNEPEIYRLKNDVFPLSYELRMVPDLEKSSFSGTVTIEVFVKLSTYRIELHSKNLKIKNCKLAKDDQQIAVKCTSDTVNDLLIIETFQKSKFLYDNEYLLNIDFEGILEDKVTGFYKSSYMTDSTEKWLATTQFESTYAREAFPCFDEPRFKAPFTIFLARFSYQKAISNMPSDRVLPADSSIGKRVWEKFKKSPPIPTYLVAFMVSDYKYITDNERKVTIWTRDNALPYASYALKQSKKLLQGLQEYTSISYKLPKLDVVAVPDLSFGAMENWGMTTYKEKYIIINEQASSDMHKTWATLIISHEFAHQWFGDLVTPAWWDSIWLNEGFATYFEYFNAMEVEPSWKLDQLFVIENTQDALWKEVVKQRAMTTPITTKSEIDDAFDIISYSKAGAVIRMWEHIVSPSTFRTALHNYLKNGHEKRGGTVTQADLFEEFDRLALYDSSSLPAGVLPSNIMKTWTENIGFPLITVTRDYKTAKVTIKQSTYKSPRAPKPAPDQEWIVPLSYTTKSELKFSETKPTMWSFANKTKTLDKGVPSDDWIIFNLQQSGYYRVNYDRTNWKLLTAQLQQTPEQIHALNRAQLVDDSLALAYDGIICYHVALQLIQYLPKEKDMIPWYSAINALETLNSRYEETSAQDLIRNYLMKIIREPYTNFGFNIKPSDDHAVKMVKPMFLAFACKLRYAECITNALEEYNKNKNDLNKVQPDLKNVVFCNALTHSDNPANVFDDLWKLYLKLDMAYDKSTILASLSCVTDQKIIKKILSKLIDSKNKEIRKPDRTVIFRTFFSRIPTVTGSIAFLHDTVSTISDLDEFGISTLKDILIAFEKNVKTGNQIQSLKHLEEKLKKLEQSKFDSFTNTVHNAYTKGLERLENEKANAANILHIIKELLQPSTTTVPLQETTEEPSSGASTTVSWLWSNLAVASLVIYYCSKVF